MEENIFENAMWIGVPQDEYRIPNAHEHMKIETAYFQYAFCAAERAQLTLFISASTRYRLWMNGQPVVFGPCKGDYWNHYYETVDVSDFLQEGENIIAVKVTAYPPFEGQFQGNHGPFWAIANAAGPCLLVKGSCRNQKGQEIHDITTGTAKWMVHLDHAVQWTLPANSFWMGSMEIVHGDKLPFGWKDRSNPEGHWVEAARRWSTEKSKFGEVFLFPLYKRPIPLLFERERSFIREMTTPADDKNVMSFVENSIDLKYNAENEKDTGRGITIPPCSHRVIELDAGELTTGYFRLPVEGGRGSRITIRYAESYVKKIDGKIVKDIRDDSINGFLIGHEDSYYPSGLRDIYEPFWFRTFRFVRIEIQSGEDPLTLYPPAYRETGYPLEVQARVESSCSWITPLWEISLRTLQRCMHETYEDCPYYEQLQYTMDTRLQMLFTYIISGDVRMALRTIHDYHSSILPEGILQSRYPSELPQIIPSFSLHWIFMLEDYYWQTGDVSIPRRYRPTVDAILDWYEERIGSFGLVERLGYWEFIDWTDQWDDLHGSPHAVTKGPSTVHNLLYAYALQTAARLNRLTGRSGVGAEYEQRAEGILNSIERHCWSEKNHLYMEGPDFEEYSQHSQIWAVLTGLAAGERAQIIMKQALWREDIIKCSFPMLFYMFRALERSGLYDETEKLWDLWKVLLDFHLTTIPEIPVNARSDCHGWGALPLFEFTRSILGINPLAPGWNKIEIKPYPLSLLDAKGYVITPKGMVYVSWVKSNEGFHVTGSVPEGIPVEIQTPDGIRVSFPQGGSFSI